jgi:outer membrane protein
MKRPTQTYTTLLLRSIVLCAGISQVAQATDLVEVYQKALTGDPQFRQVAANKRAVLEERPQALANLLPEVSLSADIAGISSVRTGSNSIGFDSSRSFVDLSRSNADTRGYDLILSQPVFHGDRYLRLKQADNSIKQADAELSAAQINLALRVSTTYFNVLAAVDSLGFAEAEKRSLSQQLEQARQRFDVGLTAVTDVQEAQAGYDRAVADEIRAINEIDNTREALREITGEFLPDLEGLDETIPMVSPEPADIESWSNNAMSNNLDVIAAIHAVDIARDEIKVQQSGHLPTVDLTARRSYNESDTSGDSENTSNTIGLQFNMPLYSGGSVSSRTRATQERLNQQLEILEQMRRQAHRQARQSYLGVMSGISQIKALQQAVVSSEVALDATRAGFEVGTRTAVDVVQSERAQFQAKRDLSRARYDYIINTLNLKQAAGILTIDDIEQINQWLN